MVRFHCCDVSHLILGNGFGLFVNLLVDLLYYLAVSRLANVGFLSFSQTKKIYIEKLTSAHPENTTYPEGRGQG